MRSPRRWWRHRQELKRGDAILTAAAERVCREQPELARVAGMWLQPPDPSAPDVVAESHWKCETCGLGWGNVISTWPQAALRFTCFCGTDVEIVPAAQEEP